MRLKLLLICYSKTIDTCVSVTYEVKEGIHAGGEVQHRKYGSEGWTSIANHIHNILLVRS